VRGCCAAGRIARRRVPAATAKAASDDHGQQDEPERELHTRETVGAVGRFRVGMVGLTRKPLGSADRPTLVRLILLMALAMVASACLGSSHQSSRLGILVRVASSTGETDVRTVRYSLDCGRPPQGTMPNAVDACTAIADLGLPHTRTACPGDVQPIMGSVAVTGSLRGKPVHLRLTTAQWCNASADLRHDYTALLLPNPGVVPRVVGLPIVRAATVLQRAGFTVSISAWTVFGSLEPMPLAGGQSVTPGLLAERGTDVALTLRSRCCMSSPLGTTRRVRMPRLLGLDARHAINRLQHAGLYWVMRLRPVDTASGRILQSLVVEQLPHPGATLIRRDGGLRIPEFTADYGHSSNNG
jgi:hypothetical protein